MLTDLAVLGGAFLASIAVAHFGIRIAVYQLKQAAQKTKSTLDDHLLKAVEKPIYLAAVIIGVNFAAAYTNYNNLEIRHTLVEIGIIVTLGFGIIKIVDGLIAWYSEEIEARQKTKMGDLIPTGRKIFYALVIAIISTMVLDSLGIEITPIIAALGLGGLAIALAFQETLTNFFSGITITLDHPIKVGDYIELENKIKGYVVSIGWRSTQIRTLPNNLVIVPNSKLSQSIMTNYYLPTPNMAVVLQCSVAYGSDLDLVEKVTIETARTIQKTVKGTVPEFDPFIRYHTFGDNGIGFSIILNVKEFTDQYLVTHEFVKELTRQYAKHHIEIPFPQRTIHLANADPPMKSP